MPLFPARSNTIARPGLAVRFTIEMAAFLVCVRGAVLRQGASRLGIASVEKETGTTTNSAKKSI